MAKLSRIRTAQVAVSTAGTIAVAAANPERTGIIIQNLDAAIICYVGESGVQPTTGLRLGVGASIQIEGNTGPIYVASASGTPSIAVLEY